MYYSAFILTNSR